MNAFGVIAALLIVVSLGAGQTTPNTNGSSSPQKEMPSAEQLHRAVEMLKRSDSGSRSLSLPSINELPGPERHPSPQGSKDIRATLLPVLSIPLSPTAMDGVTLSAKMMAERNAPVPSKDGRAMYTFGVGLPTVVCAPLRVCSLELQAGEKILGEPQIGDSVRWEITPIISGSNDSATPILVIKPKVSGLDTTMVIASDKRTYYVRLVSEPEEFMARTAFAYADDEHVQWRSFLAEQERERKQQAEVSRVATMSPGAVDKLYFEYKVDGNGPDEMRPVRVMDDGEKTYIQMPEAALHRELPALVVVVNNVNEMVNYRVKGNTYVVDRLFSKAALIIGTGKHEKRFLITRKG